MTSAVLRAKPDAGKPHVGLDGGEVVTAKPRRGSLLHRASGVRFAFVALAAFAMSLSAFADGANFTWTGAAGNNLYADRRNWSVSGSTTRQGPSWTENGYIDTDKVGHDVTIIVNTSDCCANIIRTMGSHKVTFVADANNYTLRPYHLQLYAEDNEFDIAISMYSVGTRYFPIYSNATFRRDVTIPDSAVINNRSDTDGSCLGVTPNAVHFYGTVKVASGKVLGLRRAPYTTGATVHFHGPLICDELRFGLGWVSGYAHFYSPENQIGKLSWCYTQFVCDGENVFPSALDVSWPSTLVNPANNSNELYWDASSIYNALNLNGHDQTVACVAYEHATRRPWITSGAPAVLTLNGSGTAVATVNVGGKASVRVDSPGLVQEFRDSQSTTEGVLEARRGTLRLSGATSFAKATEVAVGTGATFDLQTTTTGAMAGLTNVAVAAGGTFKVGSGVDTPFGAALAIHLAEGAAIDSASDFVASAGLWVDGEPVDSGDYVAQGSGKPGTKVPWLRGAGKLNVVRTAPVEVREWTWTGAGANDDVTTEENWKETGAPNFGDGSAYLKFGDTSHGYSATVSGPIAVNGLFMDFTQTEWPTDDVTLGGGGKVTMGDGGLTGLGSRSWTFRINAPLEFAGDQVWDPKSAVLINGAMSEKVAGLSFTLKSGSVTIVGDANKFTGPVNVNGGTLALRGASPFGESDAAISVDGDRDRALTAPNLELREAKVMRPVKVNTMSGHGAGLNVYSGTNEITKALTVSGNAAAYLLLFNGSTLILSGGFVTNGHLTDVNTYDAGTLVVRNVPFNNLYLYSDSGTHLAIEVAGCRFSNDMYMGGNGNALIETRVANALTADSPVALAKGDGSTAKWDLCGKDQQCGNLKGSGRNATILTEGEATLTVNQSANLTTAVAFDGPVTLCKRGAANLCLTGAGTANGAIRVEAGSLEMGEGFAWAKDKRRRRELGDVYVAQGATLTVDAGVRQKVRDLYFGDGSGNWVRQDVGTWGTSGQHQSERIAGGGLLEVHGSWSGTVLIVK